MRQLTAAALAWAVGTSALIAAPVSGDKKDDKTAAAPAEKIRKELDQVITMDIENQSLNLAIEQLKEQTKINFILDKVVITQMGMDPEQIKVDLKLKGVKVRSALRTLLNPYNLSYAIVEDTVVISSEEGAAQRQLRQRVSIDLDKVELAKGLKQLARETGVNLIVDARAAKESAAAVSLQLDDVPLETAVRLMVETAGLKTVRVGNVLFVSTKAFAAELRADPDLNPGQPQPQPGVLSKEDATILLPPGPGTGVIKTPPAGTATPPSKPADDSKPADSKPADADKPADKTDKPKTEGSDPKPPTR
jgi:uncharacterized protein YneF (UPF0154 family)